MVKVNDKMQKGYSYERVEPIGKNFAEDFKPELSPKEMLELGIFGGKYLNDVVKSGEFPSNLFSKAKLSGLENPADKSLNYYGVLAGSSLKDWREAGWINKVDPRGWFQWYLRYYYGRRIPDEDRRQINRWKNAKRFIRSAESFYSKNKKHSLVTLQTALHWAYDARKIHKVK